MGEQKANEATANGTAELEPEEIVEEVENLDEEPKVVKKPAAAVVEEPKVEPKAVDENKQLIFDQAGFDKIIGERVRKERERAEALEAQVNELMNDKHEALLEKLAVNGIKKERLVQTGLKGDALRDYAKGLADDLAEYKGAQSNTINLADAEKFGSAAGVEITTKTPETADAALDAVLASIASQEK